MIQIFPTRGLNLPGASNWTGLFGPVAIRSFEVQARAPWDVAGTFRFFAIRLGTAPGSGKSWTFTVYKNNVATSLSVTISDLATTGADLVNTLAVLPGDWLAVEWVATNTPAAPSSVDWSTEFEGTTASESGYAQTSGLVSDSAVRRTGLFWSAYVGSSTDTWNNGATPSEFANIVATPGTVNGYRVQLAGTPGSGKSYTFVIWKNGIAQDGTGGTPNTTIVVADAGSSGSASFSLSLVAGDRVYVECTPSGTPTGLYVGVACRFTPTTAGLSMVGGYVAGALLNSADRWLSLNGQVSATSEAAASIAGAPTTYYLSQLYFGLSVAPGSGKSFTFTVRDSGADSALAVTLSDAETLDAEVTQLATIASGDTVAIRATPAGSPAQPIPTWAAVLSLAPPNFPPVVNAGVDQAFTWPLNVTTLTGSATDADGTIASYLWTKTSGPGTVVFGTAANASTSATFSSAGTYVLRLTATDDDGATGFDELTITISSAPPPINFTAGSSEIGLSWRELYHVDAAGNPAVDLAAPVDLNDPAWYYGGFKAPRILSWGTITRALSDDRGQYESAECTWTESDTDRMIRGWFGNAFQRFLINRQVVIRMINDASRRLFATPRTLFRGIIRGYKPRSPLTFEFRAEDFISSLFGPANLQKQIPQEAIARAEHPTCPTTAIGLPVPILFGDLSNSLSATAPPTLTGTPARGFYDDGGGNYVAGFGDLTSLAGIPTAPGIVANAPGSGSLSATIWNAQWGAMVWAVDANGAETDPVPFYSDGPHGGSRGSFANAGTVPNVTVDGTQSVTVSWTGSANAVKYRLALGYYFFGFRPVVMKEVTAPTTSVTFLSETDGTAASFSQQWWYAVSAVMVDGETGLSQELAAYVRTHRREVRIEWNTVPGATAYRIYRRGPQGTYDRKWEVAAPTTFFDDDLLDTGATIISGVAQLTGVIPVTYVGIEYDVNGFPWHAFLVCGHQVEEIPELFQNGVIVNPGNYGNTILVPGQTGYSTFFPTHLGAPQYKTINGKIRTMLYARGPQGDAAAAGTEPFTINVKGRRAATGTFLTQIADIYKEFVIQFGFQNCQGGYLTAPTWPIDIDGVTNPQVDEASFDAVKTIHAARLVGGYPGAIAFGADGQFITLRDALAQLNVSADCESAFDQHSRYFVSIFNQDPAVLTAARRYTQLTDIIAESLDQDPRTDEVETVVIYSYRRYYVLPPDGRQWDIQDAEAEPDATAQGNLRERRPSRTLELHGIRVAGPAVDIANRRQIARSFPPMPVTLETPLYGLSTELGDVILVTHTDGAAAGGWTLRAIRVKRHITHPQTYKVTLVGEDVQRLYDYYNP